MKFLTGDDTGIIKLVRVEAQKVERFGSQRRGDAVERLCWCGPSADREARLAVGHASGALEVRNGSSGQVLGTASLAPSIRCLQALPSGPGAGALLAVAGSGLGSVVKGWCSEDFEGRAANGAGPVDVALEKFQLPGSVTEAQADPLSMERIVFGGGDSDVKIWDMNKGEVTWRAKNVRESGICLKVPVDVSCLQWATSMAPARSLILCGTGDGKVRLYDARAQRKPLFELLVGHGAGQGTGGYTGTVDSVSRPVTCGRVASVRGDGWSLIVGNTMGVLREYDLRHLPSVQSSPYQPGRKAHLHWAAKQMPFKRGFKGVMGSIRAVDVHCSGDALAAVGIGRHAYIFNVRKKKMSSKVYLKQKLCSVLWSSEEDLSKKDESDDEEASDVDKDGSEDDAAGSNDEVKEGFSSDEEAGAGDGDGDKEADDCEGDEEEDGEDDGASDGEDDDNSDDEKAAEVKKRKKTSRTAAAKKRPRVQQQQTTVIMPDHGAPSGATPSPKKPATERPKKKAKKVVVKKKSKQGPGGKKGAKI
eukprot:TRINITY_DN29356_c0_g1_i1.p1 TRINITY_DN29356_c0_g1~~TRINITY_DN29356_c0_g1_i1.p1  ORF type:complete len:532 (+),score=157.57 TRINITY_DN29356_c0_g1_i1:120-1715(+)